MPFFRLGPHLSSLVFPVASALLLCANLALIIQNRSLKVAPPVTVAPTVGAKIDDLTGILSDGTKATLPFGKDAKKTALFVFQPACGFCKLNWPNWQALAKSADRNMYRLVYANISSNPKLPEDYLHQYDLPSADVFTQLDPRITTTLRLHVTPITMILGRDGRVEHYWVGALKPEEFREITRLIGKND